MSDMSEGRAASVGRESVLASPSCFDLSLNQHPHECKLIVFFTDTWFGLLSGDVREAHAIIEASKLGVSFGRSMTLNGLRSDASD